MTTDLDGLATSAAAVLRRQFDADISLCEPFLLKDTTRSLVMRCRVEWPPTAAAPVDSVIVKYVRDDARGFSDWASLAFLSDLPDAHGLVPRFLGGDIANRFFVLEDLGGSKSLEDVLRKNDANTAKATLRAMAICMARLHAATLAMEDSFEMLRLTLPDAVECSRRYEAERWLGNQDQIAD